MASLQDEVKYCSRVENIFNYTPPDDMLRILENEGLENVTGEPVQVSQWKTCMLLSNDTLDRKNCLLISLIQVPHWVRGEEWAAMVEPRKQKFQILGLGTSVGTQSSHDGILEAEAVVVTSFVELSRMNESDVSKCGNPALMTILHHGPIYLFIAVISTGERQNCGL